MMQRVAIDPEAVRLNDRERANDVLFSVTLRPFRTVEIWAQRRDGARCRAAAFWKCPPSLEPYITVKQVEDTKWA